MAGKGSGKQKGNGGSRRSSGGPVKAWFRKQCSHRRLLLIEAILLLAGLESWGEAQVLESELPAWLQVLFSMALVVGLFGILLAFAHSMVLAGLKRSHDLVQSIPLPTPVLLVHLSALVALFYFHAWLLDRAIWPFD